MHNSPDTIRSTILDNPPFLFLQLQPSSLIDDRNEYVFDRPFLDSDLPMRFVDQQTSTELSGIITSKTNVVKNVSDYNHFLKDATLVLGDLEIREPRGFSFKILSRVPLKAFFKEQTPGSDFHEHLFYGFEYWTNEHVWMGDHADVHQISLDGVSFFNAKFSCVRFRRYASRTMKGQGNTHICAFFRERRRVGFRGGGIKQTSAVFPAEV